MGRGPSRITELHEDVLAYVLEAGEVDVRPGRTMVAQKFGLTPRKARTVLERLEKLGLLASGDFGGASGGYVVDRDNPWVLRRIVALRDARVAMRVAELVTLEQLATLTTKLRLTQDVTEENRTAVREALAGLEPVDARWVTYWVADAHGPLVSAFGWEWWPDPPPPPLHRNVHLALTAVDPASRWSFEMVTPRGFEFFGRGGEVRLVLDQETSLVACLIQPGMSGSGGPGGDMRVVDRQAVRADPGYLRDLVAELVGQEPPSGPRAS